MNSPTFRPRARPRYPDDASVGSGTRGSDDQQSAFTGALDEFRIHCPNCSHQFTLGEGLLMEEKRGEAASRGADTAHDSVESLGTYAAPPAGCTNETLLKVASESCDLDPDAGPASPDAGPGTGADDAKSSQPVSRCYQILNWTVEELEKVICDPNDRRIRKISSISQCDIEVRSEMAPTKFGAPKNFCILRAAQAMNIDQCRSLLKRQLLWVLKPKAQEADSPVASTVAR